MPIRGRLCPSGWFAFSGALRHGRHLPCSRSRGVGSSRGHRHRGAAGDARSRSRAHGARARAAARRDRGQPRRRPPARGPRARPGGGRLRGRARPPRGRLRPADPAHRHGAAVAHPHRRSHRRDPAPGVVAGRLDRGVGRRPAEPPPERNDELADRLEALGGPASGWAAHADVALPNGLRAAALVDPGRGGARLARRRRRRRSGARTASGASVRWLGRVAVAAVRLVARGASCPTPARHRQPEAAR